ILFLFLIFSSSLLSQTAIVEGRCVSKNKKNLELVRIYSSVNHDFEVITGANGKFKFSVPAHTEIQLDFIYEEHRLSKTVKLAENETKKLGDLVFDISVTDQVVIRNREEKRGDLPKLKPGGIATSDIGKTLVLTTVASSNNELTSNYN